MNCLTSCMINIDISGSTPGTLLLLTYIFCGAHIIFPFLGLFCLGIFKIFYFNRIYTKLILIQFYLLEFGLTQPLKLAHEGGGALCL